MFLRPSFNPTSFSPVSFAGATAPLPQDGRSGYWRLFFTQLQEQANEELEAKAPVVNSEVKPVEAKPKLKTKKKPIREAEVEDPGVPKFNPLPMYEAKADEPTYLQQMWDITLELRVMIGAMHGSMVEFNKIKVAEDEDDIEALLLLVM